MQCRRGRGKSEIVDVLMSEPIIILLLKGSYIPFAIRYSY